MTMKVLSKISFKIIVLLVKPFQLLHWILSNAFITDIISNHSGEKVCFTIAILQYSRKI